jgi:hypothetical protein
MVKLEMDSISYLKENKNNLENQASLLSSSKIDVTNVKKGLELLKITVIN